ncbi:hypothetical protein DENIS_0913 [Desulfonema ishimotonii]|uniref:Teneurin-like YD-shell domain-containing protein n=1 Tax=Desulfonema ishimotonii TaxID=45657 RepID=A0A401FSM0_9BACT|nr:RHS repeat-associated core domain-containing protein [Desulfonema ishimotonii]GBC59971.1 hypothetical protein DENIS_0913 [Desulfonema ishimotonii]
MKRVGYDAFGNVISDSDTDFAVPFGFAGGLHDRDTGLIRFGYRDYDPDTGRWTAKDPILFAGGDTDLYGYCVGDPVNGIDPDGRFVFAAAFAFGAISSYGGLAMLGDAAVAFAIGQIIASQMAKDNLPDISILGGAVIKDSGPCPTDPDEDPDEKPASEQKARNMAKNIEKDLGKEARRRFHDIKNTVGRDRTLSELKADARIVYQEAGKKPPTWSR